MSTPKQTRIQRMQHELAQAQIAHLDAKLKASRISTNQAPFIPFWWPDHVIGKRESRAIREQHNALFNSHAELLAALRVLTKADADICGNVGNKADQAMQRIAALDAAESAIAKAEGTS